MYTTLLIPNKLRQSEYNNDNRTISNHSLLANHNKNFTTNTENVITLKVIHLNDALLESKTKQYIKNKTHQHIQHCSYQQQLKHIAWKQLENCNPLDMCIYSECIQLL